MKAFLLAAGVGSRLRPLTDSIPKCLVPIQGQPLLAIWLELLQKFGVTEVLVNAYAHHSAVAQFLLGRFPNHHITLAEEPQLLGSAGTLAANRKWVGAEPTFWVLYGDVLTNAHLQNMLRFHESHPSAATLGVYRVPDPRRCGIAVVDQAGKIERFVEKPAEPPGNLAFAGLLVGTQALLEAIPPPRPADLGFDVFPRLAGQMFAYPIREFLLDVGTPENYQQAQLSWPGL
jgi:mannose-1-phosphate guanylyltransferase